MNNPVVVEVVRGALIESAHRGSVAVRDAYGHTVFALGDVSELIYPRSAVKPFQALPLVESGAADRYCLSEEQLALACASHSGEHDHVVAVANVLERIGYDYNALRCGAHWPLHEPSAHALARSGENPTALHNNCSGKHAGFLCLACEMGADHQSYNDTRHAVQREVKATIENLVGADLSDENCAIDGCSVPTWAMSLSDLALGFARFGTGYSLEPERARAARRLRVACAAKPWHFAGTGRFSTTMVEYFGQRVFVKVGAEGVYGGALPDEGFGIAIKCEDGAWRAASVMMAAIVIRFLKLKVDEHPNLQKLLSPILYNWNGIAVGRLRPTTALLPD